MTYSLPFGLKQKPLNHYFEHGVIKFSINEGKLFYTIKKITKNSNSTLCKGTVMNKIHLDQLLAIKNLDGIHSLEEVINQ